MLSIHRPIGAELIGLAHEIVIDDRSDDRQLRVGRAVLQHVLEAPGLDGGVAAALEPFGIDLAVEGAVVLVRQTEQLQEGGIGHPVDVESRAPIVGQVELADGVHIALGLGSVIGNRGAAAVLVVREVDVGPGEINRDLPVDQPLAVFADEDGRRLAVDQRRDRQILVRRDGPEIGLLILESEVARLAEHRVRNPLCASPRGPAWRNRA